MKNVTIGISSISFSLPLLVAKEKGFFQEQNIEVAFVDTYTEATSLCRDVLSGHLDAGGFVALPIFFDMETKNLGSLRFSTLAIEQDDKPFAYLLKRSDKPHSQIADMRGKKIGIFPTKAFRLWLEIILHKENISMEEVTVTEISVAEQGRALETGTIDFLFTNDPTAGTLIENKIGDYLVTTSLLNTYILEQNNGYPIGGFVFNRNFIDKHPKMAKKINETVNKAVQYIQENETEALSLSEKYFTKNTHLLSYWQDREIDRKAVQQITDIYYHHKLFPKPLNATLLIFEPGYLVELKDLRKDYPRPSGQSVQALDDFTLTLAKGEFVTLFGPNGSGKTTILNIVSGFISPDAGTLQVNGKNLEPSQVGYVHQDYRKILLPWKKIIDNIALPLEIQGIAEELRHQEVRDLCELLAIDIPLDSYPNDLSGGQQQMAVFVTALIKKPELVLFDEPFSAIDYQNTQLFQKKLLDIWHKLGLTILFISHDIDEAVFLAQRVCLLTPRPTKISRSIENLLAYPRGEKEKTSQEFLTMKKEVAKAFNTLLAYEK